MSSEVDRDIAASRKALNKYHDHVMAQRGPIEKKQRQCMAYVRPGRGRFSSIKNDDDYEAPGLINTTATLASDICASGLVDNMASPQRVWFEYDPYDVDIEDDLAASDFLMALRDLVLRGFAMSNFYGRLHQMFADEADSGTTLAIMYESEQTLFRFVVITPGTYGIAMDSEGTVDTMVREFKMSYDSIAERFGIDSLSENTRKKLAASQAQGRPKGSSEIVIRHAIMPNPDYVEDSPFPQNWAWREVYWEAPSKGESKKTEWPDYGFGGKGKGMQPEDDGIMEIGGFRENPLICGRWSRRDDDVWATSWPALSCIYDVKGMQEMEADMALAIEKGADPPMQGPATLDAREVSSRPGEFTAVPEGEGAPLKELHGTSHLNLDGVANYGIARAEERVRQHYKVNFFLMLTGDARNSPPTAEEVRGRDRERATVLSPILEANEHLFRQIINRATAIVMRRAELDWIQGSEQVLPFPPESLSGAEVRPRYISEVAVAQRLTSLVEVERWLEMGRALAELDQSVLDNADLDFTFRNYGKTLGVDPEHMNTGDQVAAVREQRAQMQAEREARAAAMEASQVMQTLSQAQPGNALGEVVGDG